VLQPKRLAASTTSQRSCSPGGTRVNVWCKKTSTTALPEETIMKVTGGCHCGHITYEAEVDPATVRVCHCTDCQKLTGTAFRANITSVPETFRLKSGAPKIYVKTAESGNKHAQPSARNAARRSMPPHLSQTRQLTVCGSAQSTSAPNLRLRRGKSGAVRHSAGRWICVRSRSPSGSDRRACRWRSFCTLGAGWVK
jgi:hypothetical protein